MKIMLSNTTLTVKLSDGTMLTTTEGSEELYYKVLEATSDDDIRSLLMGDAPDEVKKKIEHNKETKEIKKYVDNLTEDEDFITVGNDVYMKGVSISMPKVLVKEFTRLKQAIDGFMGDTGREVLEARYNALKNFWLWTSLNPNPSSREDLYTFIEKNKVEITPKGNMVLYRRIVKKSGGSSELIEFISKNYVKIKKNKKSPSKYWVASVQGSDNKPVYTLLSSTDEPQLQKDMTLEGNLKELYLDLPSLEDNLYTDNHTKSLTIRVGDVYKISEEDVDLNNKIDCSRGLHCASRSYNYSNFGDTPVMVLVNPSKVRAVPQYNTGKMRVVEMFIASVLELDDEGQYIDEGVDVLDLDGDYFNIAIEELKQLAKTQGATEEVGQGVLGIQELTLDSFNSILVQLDEVKDTLGKRIITL